jgi:hypothetical protein
MRLRPPSPGLSATLSHKGRGTLFDKAALDSTSLCRPPTIVAFALQAVTGDNAGPLSTQARRTGDAP